MNTDKTKTEWIVLTGLHSTICVYLCSSLVLLISAGCTKPSAANIELRKQNQALREEVAALHRARLGDAATIAALEQRGATTAPTLPHQRLDELFTVHGLKLGRLTGGADIDAGKPGDEAIKVYVTPVDQDGQPLKAAGEFVVELFDLNRAEQQRIGRWEFPLEAARSNWFGAALLYTYVLTCPWQTLPQNGNLTLKASFTDALTLRRFEAQTTINVYVPAQ